MRFCPWDGTLLIVDQEGDDKEFRFRCVACPYVSKIGHRPYEVTDTLKVKEEDDVLGGEGAWANVPKTDAVCPKCNHKEAFYMQFQTRSADEPMTVFYKCCACGNRWKD